MEEQPINGGILFVKKSAIRAGVSFFQHMYAITHRIAAEASTLRRWFGTSDQVALSTVLKPENGYTGAYPGVPSSPQPKPYKDLPNLQLTINSENLCSNISPSARISPKVTTPEGLP